MNVQKLAESIEENDEVPVSVSALVYGDEVGYPERIVNPDQSSRPGEHKNFDEAYDFACEILDVDNCEVDRDDDGYVWFKKA